MKRNALVIGATGKTGRRLVPLLRKAGMEVRAASRAPVDGMVAFDWHDRSTHPDVLAGMDAAYLVPPAFLENPVPLVEPFLATAAAAGVRKIVLVSSMGAGFPAEPADSGRSGLEMLVRECGLDWTILRPSGFMQNFSEGFLLPAVRHGVIPNPAGDGLVAMVDAADIASVAAAILAGEGSPHSRRVLDVTGPALLGFADAAAMIAKVAGRPVETRAMTPGQFLSMLEGAGVPPDYAAMLVRDQEAVRSGAAAVVSDNVARIIGRAPGDFAAYAAAAAPAWRS